MNQQTTPIAQSDVKANLEWQETYAPYGKRLLQQSKDTQQWYTGETEDKETGFIYLNARYYDPEIARFISPDPVHFKEQNPMSFNRYAYANNNPMKFVDPMGTDGRRAAEWAMRQIGNSDYQWWDLNPESHGKWVDMLGGRGAPKCNAFVWDALTAGGDPPSRMSSGRIPTTREWGNGLVPGYFELKKGEAPELGDVVLDNGHMGLYFPLNGNSATISASSDWKLWPMVIHNDWGFRHGNTSRIFRCERDGK